MSWDELSSEDLKVGTVTRPEKDSENWDYRARVSSADGPMWVYHPEEYPGGPHYQLVRYFYFWKPEKGESKPSVTVKSELYNEQQGQSESEPFDTDTTIVRFSERLGELSREGNTPEFRRQFKEEACEWFAKNRYKGMELVDW